MKEVVLTKIERIDDQINIKGEAYQRVYIWTDKGGDTKVSGFGDAYTDTWKEGDTVILDIYPMGKFWNFKVPADKKAINKVIKSQPTALELIQAQLQELNHRLGMVEQVLREKKSGVEKVFDEMEGKQPFQQPTI